MTEPLGPGDAAPRRRALGLRSPAPVLAIAGTTRDVGADLREPIGAALSAAVAAAASSGAVIVTGGTDAGVLHLLRDAVLDAGPTAPAMIGVAPAGLVTLPGQAPVDDRVPIDGDLSALVRVEGERWGDETPMLSRVVGEISGDCPAVALVVGGGSGTIVEVAEHLRRGRPVVVVSGSGRLADALAAGDLDGLDARATALVAAADLRLVPLDRPDLLRATVSGALRHTKRRRQPALRAVFPRVRYRTGPVDPLVPDHVRTTHPRLATRLAEADRVVFPAFAECDRQALAEQNRWRWFSVLAIAAGFLTTTFGAVQAWLQSAPWPGVVVVTLGAASTALTTVARRQGALQQYLQARLQAERLRSLYFEHLARAGGDAVDLEREVAEIRATSRVS